MHWIYWIYSKQEGVDRCYVGKTKDFEARKRHHKYSCNKETSHNYNCQVYKYIRENGGWDAFSMEILETCEDNVASTREFYWYNEKQAELNGNIPSRTIEQYRKQHSEQIYKKITCECGCKINKSNIAAHRKTNQHKENMLKLLEDKS